MIEDELFHQAGDAAIFEHGRSLHRRLDLGIEAERHGGGLDLGATNGHVFAGASRSCPDC